MEWTKATGALFLTVMMTWVLSPGAGAEPVVCEDGASCGAVSLSEPAADADVSQDDDATSAQESGNDAGDHGESTADAGDDQPGDEATADATEE